MIHLLWNVASSLPESFVGLSLSRVVTPPDDIPDEHVEVTQDQADPILVVDDPVTDALSIISAFHQRCLEIVSDHHPDWTRAVRTLTTLDELKSARSIAFDLEK
eukprot:CAMPEP_0194066250 /NCGR_PEP_ID=MMETSP0009_2-20130614/85918_1 /TAXON_ID=210454 /ORGANISM="Grammatophora oceanica, Strain CCMP 410" /LENGTH=103 /DNA_ID=CAMNT_0038719181 /DNA_START=652 /DNA_END=963 /DNA_ORIENTATION=-